MKRKGFLKFYSKVLVSCLIISSIILGMALAPSFARAKPVSVSISSAKGVQGSEVSLDVSFKDIPETGLTSASFIVSYDTKVFSLKSIVAGGIIHNPMFDIDKSETDDGLKVIYSDYDQTGSSQITKNGILCTIKLNINNNASSGKKSIKLKQISEKNKYGQMEDIPFYTELEKPVQVTFGAGSVAVGNVKTTVIKLKVNDPNINVDGQSKPIDNSGTKPVIIGGRTLLPIRVVIEALGGTIDWDGAAKKVTINLDGNKIELTIDNKKVYVNGKEDSMDVPPQIINSRTFVPLRYVVEKCGYSVGWDDPSKTATIQ